MLSKMASSSNLLSSVHCNSSTTCADPTAAAALSRSSAYTGRLGLSIGSYLLSCAFRLVGLTSCFELVGDTASLCSS